MGDISRGLREVQDENLRERKVEFKAEAPFDPLAD